MTIQSHPVYPHLFSPIKLAGKSLRNRIVHGSMTTRFASDSRVSDRLVTYSANRAKGGAAMIISEPLSSIPGQRSAHKVCAFNDDDFDGLKRWADAVESEDCRMLGQLQHPGRASHDRGHMSQAIGVSSLPDDLSWTVPRVLSMDEIKWMNDCFADSARRLKQAGWSGVELSAGHGHLFHQFLSPWSNRREDEYGGNLENRTRQLRDLIHAVRAACGGDFIIGLKLPGDDGVPGSIDLDEAERITGRIAQDGLVDFFCFVQGAHGASLALHLPDTHGPRAPYLPMIKRLRSATNGISVIAIGLLTDPNEAEEVIANETAELVGLGRALVTDPAWPKKAQEAREADIRYCVSCNNCWGVITAGHSIRCDNNPRLAEPDEVDWKPKRVDQAKKVVIVGAGIAGLEAGWVAATRGHHVTIFGASSEVGGKTRLHAALPGGENLSSIYDFQFLMAQRANVKFELGVTASADDILSLQPDEIVLATGADMMWPNCLPADYKNDEIFLDLRAIVPHFLGRSKEQSGTLVLYDHDQTVGTYDAVLLLSDFFERTFIVTPREEIAHEESIVARQGIFQRLYERRIQIVPMSDLLADSKFDEGRVMYKNVITGDVAEITDVALLTYSTPRIPRIDLLEPLKQKGLSPHLIGDCLTPRYVMEATHEGYQIGNVL